MGKIKELFSAVGQCIKRNGAVAITLSAALGVLSALAVTALNTVIMAIDSLIYGYYSTAYVFGALIFRIIAGVLTAVAFSFIIPRMLELG